MQYLLPATATDRYGGSISDKLNSVFSMFLPF